jgi:hypothetical protein
VPCPDEGFGRGRGAKREGSYSPDPAHPTLLWGCRKTPSCGVVHILRHCGVRMSREKSARHEAERDRRTIRVWPCTLPCALSLKPWAASSCTSHSRIMAAPHLGHVSSKHGFPCWCGICSPQAGQTHWPPGPLLALPPPPRPVLAPPPPCPEVLPVPLGIVISFLLYLKLQPDSDSSKTR